MKTKKNKTVVSGIKKKNDDISETHLSKDKAKKIKKHVKKNEKTIYTLVGKSEHKIMTGTKLQIESGKILNKQKILIEKELNENWNQYRRKNFPYITQREDQRRRRVAKYIKIKKYPFLAHLAISTLNEFIERAKKMTPKRGKKIIPVSKVFKQYGMDFQLIGDLNSPKLISDFKKESSEILKELRKDVGFILVDSDIDDSIYKTKTTLSSKKIKRRKKFLKKKGKIDSEEIETSINRSAKKLLNNLGIIMSRKKSVFFESGTRDRKISIEIFTIKSLSELLDNFITQTRHKADDEFFKIDFSDYQ